MPRRFTVAIGAPNCRLPRCSYSGSYLGYIGRAYPITAQAVSLALLAASAFALDFSRYASTYLQFINIILGDGVRRVAILSLGLLPYVSGLIVMLLAAASFPRLGALKNAGAHGRRQFDQYTRYLAVALAAFQAQGIAFGLENWPGVVIEAGWLFRIGAITTLFVLWLGDQITRHGIGNGVVVLVIAGPILGLVSGFIRFLVNKPVAPRLGW